MGDQPFEPGQLVVELRSGLRVAIGQVDRGDGALVDRRFQVACLDVAFVSRQATPALVRLDAAGQDGDAVIGRLPMPDRAVTRSLERRRRKPGVTGLDLLQAGDVGTG
jgi:hypothetical protein